MLEWLSTTVCKRHLRFYDAHLTALLGHGYLGLRNGQNQHRRDHATPPGRHERGDEWGVCAATRPAHKVMSEGLCGHSATGVIDVPWEPYVLCGDRQALFILPTLWDHTCRG